MPVVYLKIWIICISGSNFMEQLYFLAQVIVAVALGAVVGWQRERQGKPAGPRTYALVSGGAALFTVLSMNAFIVGENARVASQIVIGIGFLGAGLIFHKGNHVENLTTAAGLWLTAAVGMAVGVGYYILAVGSTLTALLVLTLNDRGLKKISKD